MTYYYSLISFYYVWSFLHKLETSLEAIKLRRFFYKIISENVLRPFLHIGLSLKADLTRLFLSLISLFKHISVASLYIGRRK